MKAPTSKDPRLARAVGIAAALLLLAYVAAYFEVPVEWELGVLYGATLGLSMQWPVVLPRTGVRLVATTGLLFEALWHHGIATALVAVLVDFAVRMAIPVGGRLWHSYRPVITSGALLAAYGISLLLYGGFPVFDHALVPFARFDAMAQVYVFWLLLTGLWAFLFIPGEMRERSVGLLMRIQQTWWMPLTFAAIAWLLGLVHLSTLPLTLPVCLALVWLQNRVGGLLTTYYQDRAVAELLRSSVQQGSLLQSTYHQVLRSTYRLCRELHCSQDETRIIGYCALLQEVDPDPAARLPLWLHRRPTEAEAAEMRRHLDETVQKVLSVGALEDAATFISFRYASWDGKGYPAVAGSAIPIGAQILAAANAVTALAGGLSGLEPMGSAEAVDWIQTHAPERFSPAVLSALVRIFSGRESLSTAAETLPDTVRQLQGLVSVPSHPFTVRTVLHRLWHLVRTETGLAPSLPDEVLAVARMASFFAASTTVEQTGQITVEAVAQLLGAKVLLALSEDEGPDLNMRYVSAAGLHTLNVVGRRTTFLGGALTRALLSQEPLQLADVTELPAPMAEDVARYEGVKSVLFVPLVGRQRTTGMVVVCMVRQHWFTPREVGLIQLMANQAAIALQNAGLIAEVGRRLSHTAELKAFTDTLLDNLNTCIIVVDPDRRVILANEAARALWGREHRLTVGDALPAELAEIFRVPAALQGQLVPERDLPWGQSTLEVQAAPLLMPGGAAAGVICQARDVTRVRAMEEHMRRVEKLAAMGELAAGAAHEIRNPLTSIRGFIQLVQAKATGKESEFMQIVLREIDRIDSIIRDLLLLAKPRDVQRQEIALERLVDEVLDLHQAEFTRKGVEVMREYDGDLRPVPVDPHMFRQLILNLIVNAVEAMEGGGMLRIRIGGTAEGVAVLEVKDTGMGIAPEDVKRLFIPFFTTKPTGTGLGLALCYGIVQAHGGSIDVRSLVGEGTAFLVRVPTTI